MGGAADAQYHGGLNVQVKVPQCVYLTHAHTCALVVLKVWKCKSRSTSGEELKADVLKRAAYMPETILNLWHRNNGMDKRGICNGRNP